MSDKQDALGILSGMLAVIGELDENDAVTVVFEVTNDFVELNPDNHGPVAVKTLLSGEHRASIKIEWTNGAEQSHARYEEARRGRA